MATVKRLNSTYTIDTTDVYITGNLHVTGAYDTVNVTDSKILDANIFLNSGETGAGVSTGASGLIVERGSLVNVSLRWNESIGSWELTNDGASYSNIATSATTGISAVVQDPDPKLGGNLHTNNYHVSFNTPTVTPPTVEAGNTLVYGGTVSGGQTGLYVVNQTVTNQELITKTRSFGFSLIL